MDSSLIFLAIIGIWLVYFVPRWVARRQRATSSGADRHSRRMRVLDRSHPATTARPASRGYLLNGTYEETRSPQPPRQHSGPGPASRRRRPSFVRIALFMVFAISVIMAPGAAVLANQGAMSWMVPAGFVGAGLLAFATLRARARAATGNRRRAAPEVVAPQAETVPAAEPAPATRPARDEIYDEDAHRQIDLAAAEAALEQARAEQEAARANLKPGEWLPTQVPLPTYLLKPAAPARRATPAPEPAPEQAPEPETIDLTWYDRHAPLRRAAGD